ncbi:MAG: MarR family winged helix-turn-helix transcriptional regulator [Thaumarchaeota archaeon]|nr:MarR family winged helix-turn-helix transcriptional regulator [Candidatus Calditenuaceae archaeon]MDW8043932.1 MarR family winged helix-turn-helix transcriptional regulator [Nitrososphaerota archaeon]
MQSSSKISKLEEQAIKLLLEREEGILQSELWHELGVTSRDGSRIAIKLERKGLVKRVKVLANDRWTLKLVPQIRRFNPSALFGAPCPLCPYNQSCGPSQSVSPVGCTLIEDWVVSSFLKGKGEPR